MNGETILDARWCRDWATPVASDSTTCHHCTPRRFDSLPEKLRQEATCWTNWGLGRKARLSCPTLPFEDLVVEIRPRCINHARGIEAEVSMDRETSYDAYPRS